jgi:hypothetical protein
MFAQVPAQLYALLITLSVQEELMLLDVKCPKYACTQLLAVMELYALPPVQFLVLTVTCFAMVVLMLMDV